MPGYRGHLLGATAFYVGLTCMLSLYTWPVVHQFIWFISCLAGGLFPDIDTKSMGQRIFYSLFLVSFFVLWFYKQWHVLGALSLFSLVPLCVNHRGLTHNAWFICGFTAGVGYWLALYMPSHIHVIRYASISFAVGALSHLYFDLGVLKMFKWRV